MHGLSYRRVRDPRAILIALFDCTDETLNSCFPAIFTHGPKQRGVSQTTLERSCANTHPATSHMLCMAKVTSRLCDCFTALHVPCTTTFYSRAFRVLYRVSGGVVLAPRSLLHGMRVYDRCASRRTRAPHRACPRPPPGWPSAR